MKTLLLTAFILTLNILLIAEEVVLKIATVTPEGSLWTKKLRDMDKEIQKKTKGRVKFKIYADSRKGNEAEVAKKIDSFKIDGALFLQSGIEKIAPSASILKLPYFYSNYEHWQKAHQKIRADLEASLSKKQIKIFGWLDMGFTYAFTNKRVESLKDFQQISHWLYTEESLMKTCFTKLRLSGKEIKVKEVLQSLQKKDINSVYASPYLLVALQWHNHIQYAIDLPVNNASGGFILHEKAYESIPTKMRKKVKRVITKHMKLLSKATLRENEVAKNLLRSKYKIQFIKPNSSWSKKCQNLGREIANEQQGKLYSKEQLQLVK